MPDLDFPYHFSGLGRTATTNRDDHIRDLIQQVLFTAPGERKQRIFFDRAAKSGHRPPHQQRTFLPMAAQKSLRRQAP